MKVIPLAADSLGVRSMATYVEVAGTGILIDPGATIAASRFNLPPAPEEWDALRRARNDVIHRATSVQQNLVQRCLEEAAELLLEMAGVTDTVTLMPVAWPG